MFTGKVHNLRHFGFRHFIGVNPAFAYSVLVDMHHDAMRGLGILVEEALKYVDDELHRRVVIVEQQDTIKVRSFGLRTCLGNDRSPWTASIAFTFAVVICEASRLCGESNFNRRHCFVCLPNLLHRGNAHKAICGAVPGTLS